jgi:hypothetical protein
MTIDHEHDFGVPDGPGHVQMCRVLVPGDCVELRIADHKPPHRWRELTGTEKITVTAHMMEAIAIAQTGRIIHGPVRGPAWAREVLGYPPEG